MSTEIFEEKYDEQEAYGIELEESAEIALDLNSDFSVGPVKIEAELEGNDKVRVRVKIFGSTVAKGNLTRGQNSLSAKAHTEVAKASVKVIADFDDQEVRVEGKTCVRKLHIVIPLTFKWSCKKFKSKILSW